MLKCFIFTFDYKQESYLSLPLLFIISFFFSEILQKRVLMRYFINMGELFRKIY